jgi:UDP-glucose 6-dehydrogenase
LIHCLEESGLHLSLPGVALEVNKSQKVFVQQKAKTLILGFREKRGKKPIVGIWGLAFKANTSDVRETPAENIVRGLADVCEIEVLCDPEKAAREGFQCLGRPPLSPLPANLTYAGDPVRSLGKVDILIIVTEWHVFKETLEKAVLDRSIGTIAPHLTDILDLRNLMIDAERAGESFREIRESMSRLGITYHPLGIPDSGDR